MPGSVQTSLRGLGWVKSEGGLGWSEDEVLRWGMCGVRVCVAAKVRMIHI